MWIASKLLPSTWNKSNDGDDQYNAVNHSLVSHIAAAKGLGNNNSTSLKTNPLLEACLGMGSSY
jgi:hypothetical protein